MTDFHASVWADQGQNTVCPWQLFGIFKNPFQIIFSPIVSSAINGKTNPYWASCQHVKYLWRIVIFAVIPFCSGGQACCVYDSIIL